MVKKRETQSSIEKALNLIEILKEKERLGVTDLSRLLGLNKNNVFRLLATLQVEGIIEQDEETEEYKLGTKVLYLEYAYLQGRNFLKKSKPYLRQLRRELNETVYISILDKDDIIYIYSEEANRSVLVHSRIAKRFKAKDTAPGRALLKAKKGKKQEIIEYDFQGLELEVSEVATVIYEDKIPKAAISVVAPISRLNPSTVLEVKEKILNCANKISQSLSV